MSFRAIFIVGVALFAASQFLVEAVCEGTVGGDALTCNACVADSTVFGESRAGCQSLWCFFPRLMARDSTALPSKTPVFWLALKLGDSRARLCREGWQQTVCRETHAVPTCQTTTTNGIHTAKGIIQKIGISQRKA